MKRTEIVSKYDMHILLRRKGKGDASALIGKVAMLLFFVSDQTTQWTPAARNKFLKNHDAAMKLVMDTAKKHSVSVIIDTFVEDITASIPGKVDGNSNDSSEWTDELMSKYDRKFFGGYRRHYKYDLRYDQIAVAFVFNRDFRCFAHQDLFYSTECSILNAPSSTRTIIHELCHQFGATDIYPFENCMENVRDLKYPSIMAYNGGIYFDSLTAYILGWSDEIDDRAVELLELTKHLKLKDLFAFTRRS